MAEVIINGDVYKEVPIKSLIVEGESQSGFTLSSEQLKGKDKLHLTIETEEQITIIPSESQPS